MLLHGLTMEVRLTTSGGVGLYPEQQANIEWLAQRVTLDRAVKLLSRVLDALEYAHGSQPPVIHGTVKPSNVLMAESDWPAGSKVAATS